MYIRYCHAMKDNMESNVIGNARVSSKDNTSDGKQASGLILKRNVTEVLSLRQGITGRERLIRSHSSARFCFELSGNSN